MIEFDGEGQGLPRIEFVPDPEKEREAAQDILLQEIARIQKYAKVASLVSVHLFEATHTVVLVSKQLERKILKSAILSRGGGVNA